MLRALRAMSLFKERSDARPRRVAREALWVALGQGAGALGGLVGVRLLTHALPPATYGELALGMTIAILAQQTTLLPVAGSALRFFSSASEIRQTRAFMNAIWKLLLHMTLLMGGVVTGLSMWLWSLDLVKWVWITLGAVLFSLLSGYGAVLDGIQTATRHRAVVSWHDALSPWLRFLVALELISVLGASGGAAMAGYAIAAAVVLSSQILFFRLQILKDAAGDGIFDPPVQSLWRRRVLDYARPLGTWGAFAWAHLSSDRWALQWFATGREVGLYAAVYQLGYYPMVLLANWIGQVAAPILFGLAGDGSDVSRMRETRRLSLSLAIVVLVVTLVGVTLTAAFHADIFALLVAPSFRGVSVLLPVLVLSGGIFAAGQVMALALMSDVHSRALLAPKVVTALVGILLNVLGARWIGLSGVAVAGVVFSSIYLGWIVVLTRRQV